MTRNERAIQLRDLALPIVQARGKMVPTKIGSSVLAYNDKKFEMIYRTPFPKLPHGPEFLKYLAALQRRTIANLPYGLDIWRTGIGKVLNIEWSDDGSVDVVSYRTGEWEFELKNLARTHRTST
jgi:hypothetical protein